MYPSKVIHYGVQFFMMPTKKESIDQCNKEKKVIMIQYTVDMSFYYLTMGEQSGVCSA